MKNLSKLSLICSTLMLSACGGGGGSSSDGPTPTPPAPSAKSELAYAGGVVSLPTEITTGSQGITIFNVSNKPESQTNLLKHTLAIGGNDGATVTIESITDKSDISSDTMKDGIGYLPASEASDEYDNPCQIGQSLSANESCQIAVKVYGEDIENNAQTAKGEVIIKTNRNTLTIPGNVSFEPQGSANLATATPFYTQDGEPVSEFQLTAGSTLEISLANTGNMAINYPQLVIADWLKNDIDLSKSKLNYIGEIKPGNTKVLFKIVLKSSFVNNQKLLGNIKSNTNDAFTIKAANLKQNIVAPITVNENVTTGDVYMPKPGNYAITLNNDSNAPITVTSDGLSLPSGVSKLNDYCDGQIINPGKDCTIALSTSVDAYGQGDFSFNYQIAGSNEDKTVTGDINIGKTVLKPFMQLNTTLTDYGNINNPAYVITKVENMGPFTARWQTLKSQYDTGFSLITTFHSVSNISLKVGETKFLLGPSENEFNSIDFLTATLDEGTTLGSLKFSIIGDNNIEGLEDPLYTSQSWISLKNSTLPVMLGSGKSNGISLYNPTLRNLEAPRVIVASWLQPYIDTDKSALSCTTPLYFYSSCSLKLVFKADSNLYALLNKHKTSIEQNPKNGGVIVIEAASKHWLYPPLEIATPAMSAEDVHINSLYQPYTLNVKNNSSTATFSLDAIDTSTLPKGVSINVSNLPKTLAPEAELALPLTVNDTIEAGQTGVAVLHYSHEGQSDSISSSIAIAQVAPKISIPTQLKAGQSVTATITNSADLPFHFGSDIADNLQLIAEPAGNTALTLKDINCANSTLMTGNDSCEISIDASTANYDNTKGVSYKLEMLASSQNLPVTSSAFSVVDSRASISAFVSNTNAITAQVTLKNNGTPDVAPAMNIKSISSASSLLIDDASCVGKNLAAGQSCSFSVILTPEAQNLDPSVNLKSAITIDAEDISDHQQQQLVFNADIDRGLLFTTSRPQQINGVIRSKETNYFAINTKTGMEINTILNLGDFVGMDSHHVAWFFEKGGDLNKIYAMTNPLTGQYVQKPLTSASSSADNDKAMTTYEGNIASVFTTDKQLILKQNTLTNGVITQTQIIDDGGKPPFYNIQPQNFPDFNSMWQTNWFINQELLSYEVDQQPDVWVIRQSDYALVNKSIPYFIKKITQYNDQYIVIAASENGQLYATVLTKLDELDKATWLTVNYADSAFLPNVQTILWNSSGSWLIGGSRDNGYNDQTHTKNPDTLELMQLSAGSILTGIANKKTTITATTISFNGQQPTSDDRIANTLFNYQGQQYLVAEQSYSGIYSLYQIKLYDMATSQYKLSKINTIPLPSSPSGERMDNTSTVSALTTLMLVQQ